jgi:hypothetical protein
VTTTPTDLGTYLLQYGPFGLIFLDAFITRKVLMPIWAHKDAMKAKDNVVRDRDKTILEKNTDIKELKTSLDKLQALTRDQMLPALVRANQLSADYLAEITHRGPGTLPVGTPRKTTPRKRA